VSESVVGLAPLVFFEQATRWLPYYHRFLNFPICQNLQHTHAHKGLVCSSIFF
jgi:hypothetical protein